MQPSHKAQTHNAGVISPAAHTCKPQLKTKAHAVTCTSKCGVDGSRVNRSKTQYTGTCLSPRRSPHPTHIECATGRMNKPTITNTLGCKSDGIHIDCLNQIQVSPRPSTACGPRNTHAPPTSVRATRWRTTGTTDMKAHQRHRLGHRNGDDVEEGVTGPSTVSEHANNNGDPIAVEAANTEK